MSMQDARHSKSWFADHIHTTPKGIRRITKSQRVRDHSFRLVVGQQPFLKPELKHSWIRNSFVGGHFQGSISLYHRWYKRRRKILTYIHYDAYRMSGLPGEYGCTKPEARPHANE